jgi:L-ascorbate metabolism protein UlaG (beta-lactamase superfamily)
MNLFDALGKAPSGERLSRCQQAVNYRDGAFHNEEETGTLIRRDPWPTMLRNMMARDNERVPSSPIPAVDTDWEAVEALPGDRGVWLGHSSYFLRLGGRRILVDPVLSGAAAPLSFAVKAFHGSDPWHADRLPDIDLLILTHDHYDHLDADTVSRIRGRVGHVLCALGVGGHLEHWGYPAEAITELAWGESSEPLPGLRATAQTSRHFSGRGMRRANTLWSAFVLDLDASKASAADTTARRYFIGGDSGYGAHFARIGREYGPFDQAWLECGQYGRYWPQIHTTPEETVQAAQDLGARLVQPVHWAKFALAMHAWNEPIRRFVEAAERAGVAWTAPVPGEAFRPGQDRHTDPWWA